MRNRRFARRPARRTAGWSYADGYTMVISDNNVATWQTVPLMPAQRIQSLLDYAQRDHLVVTGILMWLNFWWQTPDTGGPLFTLPDVDLFVIKGVASSTASLNQWDYAPFVPPVVPSAVTAWDNNPVNDGNDPFLWTHRIRGQMQVSSPPSTANIAGNVTNVINGTGQTAKPFGETHVEANWQPSVHIRSKRKCFANDEIRLVMKCPGTNTLVKGNLQVAFRVLSR